MRAQTLIERHPECPCRHDGASSSSVVPPLAAGCLAAEKEIHRKFLAVEMLVVGKNFLVRVGIGINAIDVTRNRDAGLNEYVVCGKCTTPIEYLRGNQLKATFTRFAELNLRSSSFCNETFLCC
jgi:hypothetical protein